MSRPAVAPLLALSLVSAWPMPAAATDAAISEIVVTATRRATDAEDVIESLTLINGERVRELALTTDALANNVGVFLQQTTPGQGAAVIRGLKGSAILHLVDGMRLNNAIFRSAPTQYLAMVPAHAVERIEILRGTPASLYGSDAVAGAVQVVTRVPAFDTTETSARGETFAGFDSAELSRTLRAYVDVGNDRVAATLGAGYQRTGDRRTGGGPRIGPSGFDARSARVAVSLTPDERRGWLLDLQAYEQPSTPRVDELVPGFGRSEPDSSEFLFSPNRRLFAHIRHTLDAGPIGLDWKLDAAWQRIDDDRTSRAFGTDTRRSESNRSDLLGASISAAKLHDGGSWIVGAEYYHDRVRSARSETDLATGAVSQTAARYPDGATLRQAAVYANADARISGAQAVTGGIRLTRVDVDLPATGVTQASRFDVTNVSGDVGWRVDVADGLTMLANVGAGFRAPNVFDLGTLGERPGNRFNTPNTELDSETVYQWDIGLRHRGGWARVDLTLFHLRYEDRITSVPTGRLTPDGREIVQSQNAARADVSGIEIGVNAMLAENVQAEAILNYARGDERLRGEPESPGDRIPPLNGLISVTWQYGAHWAFAASLAFADAQNRLSERDIRDPRIDPAGTAGWGSLGARMRFDSGTGWRLGLGVDNVFDTRYRNHGSGIDAPGRSLFATLQHRWR